MFMPIKINDLILPKEKLEKEYRLVNVARWQKDGEASGWSYECVLSKLRYEKINVKVAKDLDIKVHKKKAFFKSQNLKLPRETKRLTEKKINKEDFDVLFSTNYIRKTPKFLTMVNEEARFEKVVEFEESKVTYTKIKKDKNPDTH